MNESLHVVCTQCHAVNRIPADKLAALPKCGKCHQLLYNAHPVELNSTSFDTHINNCDIPVLVDFWAPWCGPCKMMAPFFLKAATELEPQVRLAKVDTEAEPNLGSRFNIRSIPTLALFKNGKEVARQAGAMQASEIVRWTLSHL